MMLDKMFTIADLFQKDGTTVAWSLHTTMNLDIVYQATIMAMQNSNAFEVDDYRYALGTKPEHIAFFYNAKTPVAAAHTAYAPSIPMALTEKYRYPVQTEVTFHTKLSLVKFCDDTYRLAVYSKNFTYATNCLEVAMMFDVEHDATAPKNENGAELNAFFDVLKKNTKPDGAAWLAKIPTFQQVALIGTEDGTRYEYQIRFGGMGKTLYQKIKMAQITADSVVITPPAFIQGNKKIEDYFSKTNPVLYDAKAGASHAKLYLLDYQADGEGAQPTPALYFGSANCTTRGIGWGGAYTGNSIECLVGKAVTPDEFTALKAEMKMLYQVYQDFDTSPLLQPKTPDEIGEFFATKCTVTGVEYYNDACVQSKPQGKITEIAYTFQCAAGDLTPALAKKLGGEFAFHPLEYGAQKVTATVDTNQQSNVAQLTVKYQATKFAKTSKMIAIGTSKAIVMIPDGVLGGVDAVENSLQTGNTFLSDMLKMDDAALRAYFVQLQKNDDAKLRTAVESFAAYFEQNVAASGANGKG